MQAKSSKRAPLAASSPKKLWSTVIERREKNKGRKSIASKCLCRLTTRRRKLQIYLFTLIIVVVVVVAASSQVAANTVAPTIDYSHNMRVLKLPRSTQPGELIYRLKGSDGDAQSQLMFGVSGIEARQLLDVAPVPKSWNEADVFLKAPLEASHYNLSIYVSDGNKTTSVESTILVTNDDTAGGGESGAAIELNNDHHQVAFDAASNFNLTGGGGGGQQQQQQLSPFVQPTKQIFSVPENTQAGEAIGLISVRESSTSELPVRFELRGKGAERFAIKYVFGPRGQSRGQLQLAQRVDYEQQNLYSLKVLALNAWTDTRLDTRNVATLDILIAVGDVQDTAPIWSARSPRSLRIASSMRAGELVDKLEAQDGDFADQRALGYALDASSPLASYLDVHKTTGEIRLRRAASELASALAQQQLATSNPSVVVFASELPDTSSYEHLWPPMLARAELPLLMVDSVNEAPQFFGGLQTNESLRLGGATVLHGFMRELQAGAGWTGGAGDGSLSRRVATLAEQQEASLLQRLQVQWFVNMSQAQAIADETIRQLVVERARGHPIVADFGQGANGTFELSLEGPDAHLFELEPNFVVTKQTQFELYVAPSANRSLFDRDLFAHEPMRVFHLELVARDFGSPQRQTGRIKCLVELLDSNDHSPVFERNLYTFQVYESAPPGQLLGSIRAMDRDARNLERLSYGPLTGKDSELFHLDLDSGLLTLAGALDREKQAQYLLLAEARDSLGATNFTKIIVNVLDVNDNAPVFAQAHYDALLQPDGQFETPLIVQAHDSDEPNSANSQVAYEIIAGNQNEQFTIDSLSGAIYPVGGGGGGGARPPNKVTIPSILGEPIVPFDRPLDSAGKILPGNAATGAPGREVEETTQRQPLRLNWPPRVAAPIEGANEMISNQKSKLLGQESGGGRSGRLLASPPPPSLDLNEQMPALDLLLNLDAPERALGSAADTLQHSRAFAKRLAPTSSSSSSGTAMETAAAGGPAASSARAIGATGEPSLSVFDPLKLPPVTTLVVRAHDFGIPIRSATCKVNIYNQALQSRTLSVILNGTVEQLNERKEAIERSFGALTGSRAQIDSLEALSDSSSLTVARLRLVVPTGHHQLVDLTDLSGLMQALDYKLASEQQRHAAGQPNSPTYIIPMHPASSNLSATNPTTGTHQIHHHNQAPGHYTDSQINSIALDSSALEKKLLIYIIIVGVCILALLIIWMIYSCCHEDRVKIVEKPSRYYSRHADSVDEESIEQGKRQTSSKNARKHKEQQGHTAAKQLAASSQTSSAIGNNLAKQQQQQQQQQPQQHLLSVDNQLGPLLTPVRQKSDHLSMYNGQVWFESASTAGGATMNPDGSMVMLPSAATSERRASSAPSNSLDSALHAAINTGRQSASLMPIQTVASPGRPLGYSTSERKFFPNAQGYLDNLASIDQQQAKNTNGSGRSRRRKVAPMSPKHGRKVGAADNEALEREEDSYHKHRKRSEKTQTSVTSSTRSCSSASSRSSDGGRSLLFGGEGGRRSSASRHGSVILESDQELLGFDSTGTPIIATHTSAPKQAEIGDKNGMLTMPRPAVIKAPSGASSYIVPLAGDTLMTREQMMSRGSSAKTIIEGQRNKHTATENQEISRLPPLANHEQSASKPIEISKEQESNSVRGKKSDVSTREDEQTKPSSGGEDITNNKQRGQVATSKPVATDKSALLSELSRRLSATSSGNNQLSTSGGAQKTLQRQKVSIDGSGRIDPTPNDRNEQTKDKNGTQSETTKVDGPSANEGSEVTQPQQSITQLDSSRKEDSMAQGLPSGRLRQKIIQQRTMSEDSTLSLKSMQNRELLEKQSIFAMTYSGIAADKPHS